MWRIVLLFTSLTIHLGACGGDAVGCLDSTHPCVCLCLKLEAKIEDQMPHAEVNCGDPAWQRGYNCDACLQVLSDLHDVSATDPQGLCSGFLDKNNTWPFD